MCGIVGICSEGNAVAGLQNGLFHLQHRGQRFVGVAGKENNGEIFLGVASGLVKQHKFLFEEVRPSKTAIGHVSLKEKQPFCGYTKFGEVGLAFSGKLASVQRDRERLKQTDYVFVSKDEVGLLLSLIVQGGDHPIKGIEAMAEEIGGAFSLVLLTNEGIFAVRDGFGFRPLVIGKGMDGCGVASESPALEEMGMEILRDARPGEILFLEQQGFVSVGQIPSQRVAHCAFEWAYIARIDSVIEGIPVKRVRHNLGATLARNDNIAADIVAPVPLSGTGYGQGYHRVSGIPYDDVFLYNRYSDRSYTPLEQQVRDAIAAEKLSVVKEAVRGQRIVLCDDSIVRGTQMRKQVLRLREAGVKEIHVRVASPPLKAPCRYNLSTRSYHELIAVRHSIAEICSMLGADTLRYNTLEDFVAAIGLSPEKLCLACWTGEYPL